MREVQSGYLRKAFENTEMLVMRAIKSLKKYKFEAIAFRGVSGALIAPIVAYKMKKTLLVVRKDINKESRHSWYEVEGFLGIKNYVIIDDQIATGETVKAIHHEIREAHSHLSYSFPQCLAIYLWEDNTIREDYFNDCKESLAKVEVKPPVPSPEPRLGLLPSGLWIPVPEGTLGVPSAESLSAERTLFGTGISRRKSLVAKLSPITESVFATVGKAEFTGCSDPNCGFCRPR